MHLRVATFEGHYKRRHVVLLSESIDGPPVLFDFYEFFPGKKRVLAAATAKVAIEGVIVPACTVILDVALLLANPSLHERAPESVNSGSIYLKL